MSCLTPQITVIYASDADEWDGYLTDCFAQIIEYPLTISHKRIEDIQYPISKYESQKIFKSDAILLVLSPDFLDLMYILTEKVYELSVLLKPSKTLVLFFGINEKDVSEAHKSVFINYNRWHRLIPRNCEKQSVINISKCLLNVLQLNKCNINEKNLINTSPQFEFSTENIFEATEKIYILLSTPISQNEKIHLSIGVRNDILLVEWKNPYTLYFKVPEFMVTCNQYLDISLICGHKYLGTRKIRCFNLTNNNNNNNNNNHMSSFYDKGLEIPRKSKDSKLANSIIIRKIQINDDDFYLKPEYSLEISKLKVGEGILIHNISRKLIEIFCFTTLITA